MGRTQWDVRTDGRTDRLTDGQGGDYMLPRILILLKRRLIFMKTEKMKHKLYLIIPSKEFKLNIVRRYLYRIEDYMGEWYDNVKQSILT